LHFDYLIFLHCTHKT